MANAKVMDKVTSLAKRRGYIFPSSEVYGGLASCWDYGPLGVRLKNNIKAYWMHAMTQMHANIEPLDASILMHPKVWVASGHVGGFNDPLVDCKNCKARFRADEMEKDPTDPETPCPNCGNRGTLRAHLIEIPAAGVAETDIDDDHQWEEDSAQEQDHGWPHFGNRLPISASSDVHLWLSY